jgi:hypothetical protein
LGHKIKNKIGQMHTAFGGETEGKRPLARPRRRWEDSIKMDLQGMGWRHELNLSGPGQGHVAGACECGNEISGFIKCGEFLD